MSNMQPDAQLELMQPGIGILPAELIQKAIEHCSPSCWKAVASVSKQWAMVLFRLVERKFPLIVR